MHISTTMESNFKLIDGTFSVQEAKEVLGNLLDFKIQFHSSENFSSEIRKGFKNQQSISRIESLKSTKKELFDYLENFSDSEMLTIFSEIQIKK